jgi:hypothetical protein
MKLMPILVMRCAISEFSAIKPFLLYIASVGRRFAAASSFSTARKYSFGDSGPMETTSSESLILDIFWDASE